MGILTPEISLAASTLRILHNYWYGTWLLVLISGGPRTVFYRQHFWLPRQFAIVRHVLVNEEATLVKHNISFVGSPCLEKNLPELCLQTEFREKFSMFFCEKTAILVPLASCWTFRPYSGQVHREKPSFFFRFMKLFINGISHVFDFWWIWISARLCSKYCI